MGRDHLRVLWQDRRGNVATLFAIAASALLGTAALAVDAGSLFVLKSRLQGAADAAALAAVSELPDEDAAAAAALDYAAKNMDTATHGTVLTSTGVELGQWNPATRTFSPGASPATAVRVSLARSAANGNPAPTHFAKVLGFDEVDVVAQSVAQPLEAAACLWALNPTESASVRLETGATVDLPNCGLRVNSSAGDAMHVESGACIDALSIGVVGGYSGSCTTPEPETGIGAFEDPLGHLTAPTYGACDHNGLVTVEEEQTATLSPGVYCGGIKVGENASVTFQAGQYVVTGTGLKIEEGATARGEQVMFYFTDGTGGWGSLLVEDDTTLELSAPASGPYAGIALFQDPATPASERMLIEDVSSAFIDGTIYAPSIQFWLETDGSLDLSGLLVADTLTFETSAALNHTGGGGVVAGGRGIVVN